MTEKRMFSKQLRTEAMKNSSLPYSFTYKIRHAFYGKICPVCGFEMSADREFGLRTRIPTIQHNKPISKGGKHELGNISVICKNCNVTIQDNETSELNAREVIKIWQMLNG
jgi:predicted restriction endonuclease